MLEKAQVIFAVCIEHKTPSADLKMLQDCPRVLPTLVGDCCHSEASKRCSMKNAVQGLQKAIASMATTTLKDLCCHISDCARAKACCSFAISELGEDLKVLDVAEQGPRCYCSKHYNISVS